MYPPINKQKAYGMSEIHEVSEHVGTNGLWLPSAVQLTDDQIKYICRVCSFHHSMRHKALSACNRKKNARNPQPAK